jgi:hypothetical protein
MGFIGDSVNVKLIYILVLTYFSPLDFTVMCTLDTRDDEADDDGDDDEKEEEQWKEGEFWGDSLLLDVSFEFLLLPVPFLFSYTDLIANHLIIK